MTIKNNIIRAGAAAAIAVVALTGCTKSIDVAVTGAEKVPGTSNLYRFCDGPTQIYFSKVTGGDDLYEFIVYNGCDPAAGPVRVDSLPDEE